MSESETGTQAMPDVEHELDGIDVEQPLVGIIMGSASDKETMAKAEPILEEAGIKYEVRVMSAHRTPDTVVEYCRMAKQRGLRVIIAGAGLSAALPGVAAAHTDLPVIGVPISAGTLGGIDALLSVSQMPPGVPVAAVGIDNSKNAAHLAVRIING
jgi:5-(carboxyamino)imidazole ribonucleotide mutase